MIRRLVEYAIRCDNEDDCPGNGSNVWGAQTRKECEEQAPSHGYVRISRGRWLCKDCAAKYLPKAASK